MKKLLLSIALMGAILPFKYANAVVAAHDASSDPDMIVCANNAMPAGEEECRVTPIVFEATIYEMGMCTEHPFDDGTGVTMDKSSCSTIFTNTLGSEIDVASAIGGVSALDGTFSSPTEGTYRYPYMVIGPTFTVNALVKGEVGSVSDNITYASDGAGSASVVVGNATGTDFPDQLVNFNMSDPVTQCDSGYINSPIDVGTIDGYLTNTALVRRATTDYSSDICTGVARLVVVMDLATPFIITSETSQLIFNFNITDYGVQIGVNGGTGAVNSMGSAPFSGYFEVR